MAALRLLPAAGVGLQAPDGGHARGEALCHRGGGGPRDRDLRQQHRTLPTTIQQDGGVSARQHTRKANTIPRGISASPPEELFHVNTGSLIDFLSNWREPLALR